MKLTKNRLKELIKIPLIIIFWLGVWVVISEILGLELLFPSPKATLEAFVTLARERDFYISCLNSLVRVLTGWGIGIALGTLLGIITSLSGILKALFEPVLQIIKATPVASFIVLALVLMSSKRVPAFTCTLITIPVVWANISRGLASPDKKLLEMADFFKMSRKNKIRDIYIPAVLPYFSAAASTTMGLAWKAGIAAEVICSPSDTIGAGIQNAKIYLETPSLFAWTVTVIILSFALEKLIRLILGEKGGRV